jgi:ferredoxin
LIEPEEMEEVMGVLREPFPGNIYIDNSKLNGFLDYFKKVDCIHTDCKRCGYCERVASQAISIDEAWRKEMIARFDKAVEILITGKIAGFDIMTENLV